MEITESDIRRWLVKEYLPNEPKEEALKKHLQLLRQIFDYGIHRKICFDNPVKFIIASDYANKCALQKKRDEERQIYLKFLKWLTGGTEDYNVGDYNGIICQCTICIIYNRK